MFSDATLALYGACQARKQAQALLENRPEVRRLDACADASKVRLVLSEPLPEGTLLSLLSGSGISGFRVL
ncbi:MAG: hypothetical protein SPG80_02895 [Candidatus Ventricola sp.]|nr:hypothetical protein [Candidatus Ventricola sp.]